eukprot:CAMPEP_0176379490 /NCGR_PEP_ID=MMETSP0126-20121128/30391_1 /TAXON_ID=141414 ORGANISM="Strombidinopsis acuminatum, Strain SPMC142" /NCGR_SAMPLE_ID=MMETSP0126 /ASSEMBLY_ACC=CAM_ASM_000229 /LENGTH=69 /DNA_ID=CAMNT_0017742281 /DNA_START=276 /DNA_END=485 /DNA_ORIENTATION=-
MKTLAQGKNSTAILKLLRVLISSTQGNYGGDDVDDTVIRDIADVVERDTGLFSDATPGEGGIAMEEKMD